MRNVHALNNKVCYMYAARTCAERNLPVHGDAHCNNQPGTVPTYGDTCTFSCDSGYELIGEAQQQCLDTGQWSADPVICQSTCICSLTRLPQFYGLFIAVRKVSARGKL